MSGTGEVKSTSAATAEGFVAEINKDNRNYKGDGIVDIQTHKEETAEEREKARKEQAETLKNILAEGKGAKTKTITYNEGNTVVTGNNGFFVNGGTKEANDKLASDLAIVKRIEAETKMKEMEIKMKEMEAKMAAMAEKK